LPLVAPGALRPARSRRGCSPAGNVDACGTPRPGNRQRPAGRAQRASSDRA
jgi:hypothetical protein